MASGASRIRSRLVLWWWDLPLRWKGFVAVALPSLALLPALVAVLLLRSSEHNLESEERATLELATLSANLRRSLLVLENAALVETAGGGTPAPDDRFAERDRALDELVARVSASIRPQAVAAADAARAERDAVERLIDVAGAATPDRAAVDSARSEVRQRATDVASQFDALDAALTAELAVIRSEIDDRGTQRLVVLVLGVLVATALSWGGMWVFTRGMVRRVETVSAVAARVIDGETSIDIEEPAKDEFGVLIGELRRAAELLILHNIELEQSRNAQRELAEGEQTMREVLRRIHEVLGREEILATTVDALGTATGSDGVLIFSVEDGRPGTVLAEWTVEGVTGLGVGATLPPDEQRDANFGALMRQPHALAIDDVRASGLLPQTRDFLGRLDVGSLLLAPVLGEEGPLAALVMLTSGRVRPWPAHSDHLAEIVAANVATALTHAQLFEREREMVQRLRDLDQAKSDFVASVSHELRTPLTSIRGYVEMLRDGDAGELEPEQQRMLEVVQRNAERLLALIENLLTLSRIESGAFRVARVPVALDGVARDAVEELRPQALGRGVELVADVTGEVPPILGDTAQLERVLLNLLTNAIKFTTDGGRVVVRVRPVGAAVELEVQDEGIGIPEAEQARLFSRFFRSSTAQERAIQGTGLGLVIVKSIIDHHGGEIAVRSQAGVGTTFTVLLPAAETTVGVA